MQPNEASQGSAVMTSEMQRYQAFLDAKQPIAHQYGPEITLESISGVLFPFQRQLVQWAVQKGRVALFCDTGLGKTLMQLEWARQIGKRTLIIAPLMVAQQTVIEASKLALSVQYVRSPAMIESQISITNYEMIEAFDMNQFGAVILDESSILKAYNGKTRSKLIDLCRNVPYRLCCTATPAPNDIAEFGNHAAFLGISTREEMLSMFFTHDDTGWRLKGHATDAFYRWMASWAMMIKLPSDIGFSDGDFSLPALTVHPEQVDANHTQLAQTRGKLFFTGLDGIVGRSEIRKATIPSKVRLAAKKIAERDGQWLIWCGLNEEGRQLHAAVPDSILIEGADTLDAKTASLRAFLDNRPGARVLISKAQITGFGLNLQQCSQMMFVGLSDSYEAWYQAIRRCWRFGQTQPVNVHVVLTEMERPILENVERKQAQATEVSKQMVQQVSEYQKAELGILTSAQNGYREHDTMGEDYTMMLGDCVTRVAEVASDSIDLSVFSPPFLSLYVYSNSERDMGNSRTRPEFFDHFGYLIQELLRVMKPGRNVACHVAQVPATLVHDGYIGIKDFRGQVIETFINRGFIYHGDITIDKDPQAQAIRTKAKALLFVQLKKDAAWLRPALADYILVFRKPGENAVPIHPDINNNEWIEWARPIWYGLRESDTLNVAEGRQKKDERHIAPLQLGTIERCVRLWSNPGETVFSPFAGIGSEGYEALMQGRKFLGIELKPEYYKAACRNLARAVQKLKQGRLFPAL